MSDTSSRAPPDLVIRIALLKADGEPEELKPSIWRRFRCSAAVNLDAFQDKILQPVMGWSRNYHTYYFRSSNNGETVYYYQDKSSAADAFGMHDSYRAQGGRRVDPTEYQLGDLLKTKGDTCYYAYDLGDHWYHRLTVEQVINDSNDDNFGKCIVLDGAMRCPDEDGEGGYTYQSQVLDLYTAMKQDPSNSNKACEYAEACFNRKDALNVRGLFNCEDFNVAKTQEAVQQALRTRQSERMGNKSPYMPGKSLGKNFADFQRVGPGQRKKKTLIEDTRGQESPIDPPYFVEISETVNIKPDGIKFALCANCGSPHQLQLCSSCKTTRYCSRDCQKQDWKAHKKQCKKDKANYEACIQEEQGTRDVPQHSLDGGREFLRKFDPTNMRFGEGDKVECFLGPDTYGTGRVLRVLHCYDGTTHAYQVQLDRSTASKMGVPYARAQIWADWDHDYQIRKAVVRPSSRAEMETVD